MSQMTHMGRRGNSLLSSLGGVGFAISVLLAPETRGVILDQAAHPGTTPLTKESK